MKFFKGDDLFFRKDEEGRDLFYPWGYPGEAFYVEENQKKRIALILYLIAIILLTDFYVAGITYNSEDYIKSVWLWISPVSILGSLYFFYVFLLYKRNKLRPKISKEIQGVSASFRFFLAMFLAHTGILVMAIYTDPNYTPFKLALVFILVFYTILCVLAFRCKGCFVQRTLKSR